MTSMSADFVDFLKWVGGTVGIGIVTLLGYLLRREQNRLDKSQSSAHKRITVLEQTFVNRADLKEEFREVRKQREAGQARVEALIEKIGEKIDTNEDKQAKTRHDINDSVHTLVIQAAVMNAKMTSVDALVQGMQNQVGGLLTREQQRAIDEAKRKDD